MDKNDGEDGLSIGGLVEKLDRLDAIGCSSVSALNIKGYETIFCSISCDLLTRRNVGRLLEM